MSKGSQEKVAQFIEDIQYQSASQFAILNQLRTMVLAQAQHLEETIKYGGLIYVANELLVCGIFVYKAHLSMEFGSGSQFSDPNKILEGKGQYRRHIKLRTPEDIAEKQVEAFIRQAIALASNNKQ